MLYLTLLVYVGMSDEPARSTGHMTLHDLGGQACHGVEPC